MVWKLQPEQEFKVESLPFQKSRADNFKTQTAIKILRHHEDSLCQVSKNSDGNLRRSCAHKKLLTDGQTDGQLEYNNTTLPAYKKEKLLVTSNFSFSQNVFHIYVSLGR